MKRINVLLLAVVTLLSTSAFAKVKPLETKVGSTASFAIIPKAKLQKYDLVYVGQSNSPVTISIYDANGERIYKQKVKGHTSFIQSLNFSELTTGNYTFEVENKEGRAKQIVSHNYTPDSDFNVIVTNPDQDKLKLLVAGFDYDHAVDVQIYDDAQRLIHKEKISVGKDFTKTFDISKIDTENVTFLVTNQRNFVFKNKEL